MPTALIIEDNHQMAENLQRMLSFFAVDSVIAYGARSGMMSVSTEQDVVFLDINMPGVDGFEVLGYIRRQPLLDKIPVIFITSDDQKETVMKARDTGALALIVKPPSMEEIEKILKNLNLI